MRPPRRAVLGALTTLAACFTAAPALALTGVPGGASAPPASPTSASGAHTSPTRPSRPTVGLLTVPAVASAGRPPRVTFRIEERGVLAVYLQATVTDLTTHTTAAVATMGWVRTGRTLAVVWPAGTQLAPGSYRVTLDAHDRHGATLLRGAHSSGEATLAVDAPPPPPTPTPVDSAPSAGVPTPAETAAAGAVFPVAGSHDFGGPENAFGAPRDGYSHQGQDILTSEGTPVLAPLSGTILTTSYQAAGAGYYAVERTAVGFDFMFAHCQPASLAVATGQAVSAGQLLCKAGQTGDATTPHLDFEIWVGGWQSSTGHPIDPLPYLEAWEHEGTAG